MESVAVVFAAPGELSVQRLPLDPPKDSDVVVEVSFTGISTGTERLLWSGRMPPFPGMGYPLVPGYEAVGRVSAAGSQSGRRVGETVFVPGAKCFGPVRPLFGGAASRLVVAGTRATPIADGLGTDGVLLALAATARHAMGASLPELIVGHGVLGRLLARLTVLAGGAPTVWETNSARAEGASGYRVVHPDQDARRTYPVIVDVSGDASLLDTLVGRLSPGGEIVLAGFYAERMSFAFPPAFIKEARFRVAAQWQETDLVDVVAKVASGRLSLAGLVTHRSDAAAAAEAYRTAFDDPACLKMVLDWSAAA